MWRRSCAALALATAVLLAAAATSVAAVRWFHSPSRNIECEVAAGYHGKTYAFCQSGSPAASITLYPNGKTKVCTGAGCLGNGPQNAFTLKYGRSVSVGPFRCASQTRGMRCIVVQSGRGFLIGRQGITRFQ
jgi:hypothetical protein